MLNRRKGLDAAMLCLAVVAATLLVGCAQLRLPRIDPLGRTVFLQDNSTRIVTPANNSPTPGIIVPGAVPGGVPVIPTQPIQQPLIQTPVPGPITGSPGLLGATRNSGPAFTQPPSVPNCADGNCGARLGRPHLQPSGSLISHRGPLSNALNRGKRGSLLTTPARIVAPVGSEVVVLAGICGGDGRFVTNQPLEWILSQDSAGQLIEVGGLEHSLFNRVVPPSSQKFSGDYAWGRTGLKEKLLTRGTNTAVDDIRIDKGQSYVTLSSASEGTSYLTTVAPKTEAWPERKSITRIHWVDGIWAIPAPTSAAAGTVHPLVTTVNRSSDGTGVEGWTVNYQIVGGVPAEFGPNGTQSAEVTTNANGQAPINIRQPAGQAVVGPTQVRVQIARRGYGGDRPVTVESGITTVNWSAPALTLRAIGPRTAGINQPYNYRIEVTNPGDQVARGVTVSTEDLGDVIQYISSSPKPAQFGNRYQWDLGDIQPGSQPRIIDIQMRSDEKGPKQICFEAASDSDQLTTETCAETSINVPCIGLNIDGPTQGKIGDLLAFNFDITNQCDRPLENVVVELSYDNELAPADGNVPNPVRLQPIARILPGETINLPSLTFRPTAGGTYGFRLNIESAAGDVTRGTRLVDVENTSEPKVKVDIAGPSVVGVGQEAVVRFTVTNVGSQPLDDVVLENRFSRSLIPDQIESGINNQWNGDDLLLSIGRLEPQQSRSATLTYRTLAADGNAFTRATVTNALGASDQTSLPIRIEPAGAGGGLGPGGVTPNNSGVSNNGVTPNNGGAANNGQGPTIPNDPSGNLGVSVTAVDRTVAVDNLARFRISVTNRRSIPDQNIRIQLIIPPGLTLQAPDPAVTGLRILDASDGSRITFEPRLEMRPGESLTFPLEFQARTTGPANLVVSAVSDRNPSAVEDSDTVAIIP